MAEVPNTDNTWQEQDSAEAVADWQAVLDSMERITDAASSLLQQPTGAGGDKTQARAGVQPARVPSRASLPGPMPIEVRARALALHARQETVIRQLEEAQLDVARQLQAVSSIPGIGISKTAVYLDVTG